MNGAADDIAMQGARRIEALERLVEREPHQAHAWQALGFAYGQEQRIPEAARAFAQAAGLDPREPRTAVAHARATLDAGLPAAHLFDHAHRLAPEDLATISGWAAALGQEGSTAAAESLLADRVRQHPDWLTGHKSLAALRFTGGEPRHFDRSYAEACVARPGNLPLRLAWFGAAAQTRDWDKALQVLADGETLLGALPALAAARAVVAAESGDITGAETLFAGLAGYRDDALQLAHLRHRLRMQQWNEAEGIALGLLQGPSAPGVWPYLSLIWRLRGDARAAWLDGAPPPIRVFDLPFDDGELARLAAVLRRLHVARGPFAEQSVRGGTQTDTDRQLFFRAEPEIQQLRARVSAAVREYVAALPAPVPGHPLLGPMRDRVLFSGSWSVRLTGHGFHVAHTHPLGWISSALYVSLPAVIGPAPAGWIRFGAPPAGLGLPLPHGAQVEPRAGRLVLFPSSTWHETLPFDDGERLVVAFDVMRFPAPHVP